MSVSGTGHGSVGIGACVTLRIKRLGSYIEWVWLKRKSKIVISLESLKVLGATKKTW